MSPMSRNSGSACPEGASDVFRRLPDRKRETVFNAAVEELALHGYQGASLNRLVKSAGISKGSIFQYFGSKLGLFRAVGQFAVQGVKDYLRKIRENTRDTPLPHRIEALTDAGFEFIESNPALAGVFFNVLIRGKGPEGAREMSSLKTEGVRYLKGILEDAREKGELDSSIDTGIAARTLFVVMEDLLGEHFHSRPGEKAKLRMKHTIDVLIHGLTPRD